MARSKNLGEVVQKLLGSETSMRVNRSKPPKVCCPEHPDAPLVEDYHAGDMICPECGLVVGDRVVDVGTEWRTFSNDKSNSDPSRVGSSENPLLDGGDLSTMIATGPGSEQMTDEFGKPMYRNRRTDRANTLFKQVNDGKALKGRSNDAIASACMYIACRQEGVPRTFKEICAVSKISKKEIGRVFKLILKTLETSVELITTGDFMSRFCSTLSLPNSVQKAATHIARKAVDLDLVPG
ncbi:hypothetical protein KUTeg_022089 [Tegillarca granosa]|uniref:Transcription initiation factor IIB n=1 Tax=Tegillarca granosa TaxID=220873 RepID=A0ABQ9EAS6_TEGGR|nr:hypothetical protein KUTeg_022089 [Tegillarca granosa]